MSRLPDSSSVNLGSCTEPLAKTRSPAGKGAEVDRWRGTTKGEEPGRVGREIRVLEKCQVNKQEEKQPCNSNEVVWRGKKKIAYSRLLPSPLSSD